jgi:hypothetical protein
MFFFTCDAHAACCWSTAAADKGVVGARACSAAPSLLPEPLPPLLVLLILPREDGAAAAACCWLWPAALPPQVRWLSHG